MYKNNKKGIGYIEIMVVVAVLLIIALFAIPRYLDLRRDAYRAQIANDSRLVEAFVIEEYFNTGSMPNNSKKVSDAKLQEIVSENKSYYGAEEISKEDLSSIGGEKYILDKDVVLKNVNTKLKGDFIYSDSGVIYIDSDNALNKPNSDDQDENIPQPTGGVWDKYDTKIDGNKVTVLGFKDDYSGDKSQIRDLPELEEDGFKVVEIGRLAFKDYEFTGQFPTLQNVEKIGLGAFYKSKFTGDLNLPKVKLLGEIEYDKTKDSYRLGVYRSSNFSTINIPNVEIIGDGTFQSSVSLKELPDINKVKEIGTAAFRDSELTGSFPKLDEVEFIGPGAFRNSKFTGDLDLPKVKILGKIEYDKTKGGYRYGAFQDSNFSTINIPNVEIIGDAAFESSISLKKLPDISNVKEIGAYAFENSELSGGFPKLDEVEFIGPGAFNNSKFTGDLNLPKVKVLGKIQYDKTKGSYIFGTFQNSNFSTINIPNVEIIGDGTFQSSVSLKELPDISYVKEIGVYAFRNSELSGSFPKLDEVEFIGPGAFRNSKFTGDLNLPKVKVLGKIQCDKTKGGYRYGAFQYSNFSTINIPNVEIIGDAAFESSISLKKLPDISNVKEIGAYAFENSELSGGFPKLDEVEFIGPGAFYKSKFTGDLNLPKVKILGKIEYDKTKGRYKYGAFQDSNFTNIYVENIELLGDYSFRNSNNLINKPNTPKLKEIGTYVYPSKFN